MGVAVARAPGAAKAPAGRTQAAPAAAALVARPLTLLPPKSCHCGAPAGLSGHCATCDRVSLRSQHAGLPGPAPPVPLDIASLTSGGSNRHLGHDFGSLGILSAASAPANSPVPKIPSLRVQTQMRVSVSGDPAEQEAQTVGRLVARMPDPADGAVAPAIRQVAPAQNNAHGESLTIHRRESGAPTADPDIVSSLHASSSAGMPLPRDMLTFMEPRFRADFSGVRIHTDQHAARLSAQLGARAFTVGRDIYFAKDEFRPDRPEGWELIAHELTHTIQQGGVRRPSTAPSATDTTSAARPAASAGGAGGGSQAAAAPAARTGSPASAAPGARAGSPASAAPAAQAATPARAVATAPVVSAARVAPPAPKVPAPVATPKVAAPLTAPAIAPASLTSAATAATPARSVASSAPATTSARVTRHATPSIQRLGIGDALNFFADKANLIPGFRMFTIVLGINPINMAPVERSAANVLRALIEFIPGGGIITQALENSGVFEKVGAWVNDKLAALAMSGAAIKQAVMDFLGTLGWSDIFDLGGVWERAKRIFTEPIGRLIDFAKGLAADILKFIKDAILLPLAKLAEGTRGWDLLIAVLGKNPITGDPVARSAENLIGGFLKLIGQEEMWDNMQKSHAVPRAWAWFQGAMSALLAFVSRIPDLFLAAFKSLTIEDVVLVVGAFQKVAAVFGGFLANFIDWAGTAIWNLLEIIFDVVSPGALVYVKKTGAALKSILKNPLPFVGNLVKAAKLGLQNFAEHFGAHLKAGLIDWLTGSLQGVYIPKALSLVELGKMALSVLGITWAQIRAKIVKALGANGETIMKALETGFDIVVALVKGGVAAAWELIKEKLTQLKDTVVDGIIGFVTDTIVQKAIPKLVSLFIPGAGFISAILSIYDTIKVFIEKLAKMVAVVKAFVDSIVAIASGEISGAASRVESSLAGLLSLAISFLAGFLGLGNITSKIMDIVHKVRDAVDKALDTAINWLVGKAKDFIGRLFGKKDPKAAGAAGGKATKTFSLPQEGHTLTAIATGNTLQVRIASDRELDILAMIADAIAEVTADKTRDPKSKGDLLSLLSGARDSVRSMQADYNDVTKQNQEFGPWAERRLAQIVNLLSGMGADGIKAFRDFKGRPLDKRYLPSGYDVRAKLYERGSSWSGNSSAKVGAERPKVRARVDKVIANRMSKPSDAAAAWSELADNLQIPDQSPNSPTTLAALSVAQFSATQYDVDHIDVLSIHWSRNGGNNADDPGRWAKSNLTNLRYITHRDNVARASVDYDPWVGPAFLSSYAQGGVQNARQIDNQPFTDAGGTPV